MTTTPNFAARWTMRVAPWLLLAACATPVQDPPIAMPYPPPPKAPATVTAEPVARDFLTRLVDFFSTSPAKPTPSSPNSTAAAPGP